MSDRYDRRRELAAMDEESGEAERRWREEQAIDNARLYAPLVDKVLTVLDDEAPSYTKWHRDLDDAMYRND